MEDPRKHQVRELITSLLMSNKRHARYLRVVAVLALAVTVIVPMAVRQYGITKTVTQTVLDCHYVGNGAHVHDASCYDAAGNLICPLAERPLHMHTEDCYDADGNLICGLEEAAEEHIHGAACFTEVTVEQADAGAMPQRAFSEDITNEDDERLVKVDVVSPKGALPEDAEMKIALVNSDDVKDVVTQAVAEKTSGKLVGLRAVDISFVNSEGREVEPLEKVTVTLADNLIDTKEDCYLVHIDDNGKATVVDPLTTEELDKRKIADEKNEVVFDADSFSTYVVALTTQDKQLTASDDETYSITVNAPAEAGIPQNSELSVTEVVPGDEAYDAYFEQALAALGQDADAAALARFFDIKILNYGEEVQPQAAVRVDVRLVDAENLKDGAVSQAVRFAADSENAEVVEVTQNDAVTSFETVALSAYGVIYTGEFDEVVETVVEESAEPAISTYEFSIQGADTLSLSETLEALGVVTADDVDAFMDSVVTVTSSNSDLMDVIKLNDDATAGQVKKSFNITTRFSAGLGSEDLERMNAKELHAGDWAIVAVKAFDTETLTITKNDGEKVKILVTDALTYGNALSAEGATYRVVVTYGDDAQIPAGAELSVRELEKDTIEYQACLSNAAAQLFTSGDKLSFARFFDIEITLDGEKIEPQAPVQVSIEYPYAIHLDQGEKLSVVHFADEGTEVISDIEMSDNRKELTYEQSSFSVTGTIIDTTTGGSLGLDNEYMLIVEYPAGSHTYYLVNNDGTLNPVTYNNDGTISTEYGMLWDFGGSWGENRRIYYQAEGTGFTAQEISSDHYRRFLDPGAPYALTEEYNNDPYNAANNTGNPNPHTIPQGTIEAYRVTLADRSKDEWWEPARGINATDNEPYWDCSIEGRRVNVSNSTPERDDVGAWGDMALGFDGTTGHIYKTVSGTRNYLGVELDSGGVPVRLIGQQDESNAVKFVAAEARAVEGVDFRNHTVGHIDISIDGSSEVDFPLAYGTYYTRNNDGSFSEYRVIPPNEGGQDVTLHLKVGDVSIEPEDMKHAVIKAYNSAGDELNDVFYINGFSSNSTVGNDTAQVRIEGSFKVADIDDHFGNEYPRSLERLQNKITYQVIGTKPVTFNLIDTDQGIPQLYEKTASGTYEPLSVTLDVALSASFDYFDRANTCPGLDYGERRDGVSDRGCIISTNMSGMDYRLSGDAENSATVTAIEIEKNITDMMGTHINPAENIQQSFGVYVSSPKTNGGSEDVSTHATYWSTGSRVADRQNLDEDYPYYDRYVLFHNKTVDVETTGKGLVYDYAVTQVMEAKMDPTLGKPFYKGMFYITENKDDIPETIVDKNNELWMYVDTYFETEYAWRNDGVSGKHVSKTFTDKQGEYRSIPEAAGRYTGVYDNATHTAADDYTSEYWKSGNDTGPFDNGFLVFEVTNRYKQIGDLQLTKKVTGEGDTAKEFEFTIELTAPDGFFLDDTYPATLNGVATTATLTDKVMDDIDPTKCIGGKVVVPLKANDVYIINELPADTTYTITEADYSADGYVATTTSGALTGTIQPRTVDDQMDFTIPDENKVEVTNDLQAGDLELKKLVTGTTATTQEFEFTIALEAPTGRTLASSYAATHSGDSSITSAAVTLSDNDTKGTVTVSLKADETFTLKGLPVGTTYTITETTPPAGYTSSVTIGSATGTIQAGTAGKSTVQFTNDYSKVDINVIKIDEKNNQIKLPGAEFELYKLTGEGQSQAYTVFADADGLSKRTTDANGELTFVGLLNGKYKIVETKSPDGYIATSPLEFYFTVSAGSTVTWTDASGTPITSQPSVTYALVNDVPTFTVSNTPGQQLPHTGGNGTILYNLCGIAMIAAAGYYGLASRRRARKEVV